MDTKMRAIIDPRYMGINISNYTDKVVELVWLMTSLEPRMRLYWQRQNEQVNTEFFYFYDHKGDYVDQTVWPAVFMHDTGRLVTRGNVLAM